MTVARELRETIVAGTSRARRELPRLIDAASRGTPVTIVAGERQVTMVARDLWVKLVDQASLAQDTAALLADPDALRRVQRSLGDIKARRGLSVGEARKLLGLEKG